MIEGSFGDNDELFFEVELIADNGLELPVDALLDTGFSGWLAMDEQDLEGLDWIYIRRQEMRTARGEFDFDLYAGKIKIDNQEFDIPVHVGDGVPEILIGRQWLKNRRLVVDISAGVLTLEAN
ncbi:MAG: aspartyl protease [Oscillatoriales cyanobacterium]|uniref:aspartyl protease n=1 Tax=Microcoleus anatoxicus TaxID=2705319 RepID=UPI00297B372D|nr:MAG: aspartyl protease [Oscillatoriales cyanobacterium]TAF05683.1 MAG: aspartyl protease [Oscillatoriales cyanobacterium]TAF44153.1 MAG: aspartyl protease [Oscillatoriales cyanobacterium]TAF65050.1 MAG: aspartyl protease [Oscillatoriales cyanobacterium]